MRILTVLVLLLIISCSSPQEEKTQEHNGVYVQLSSANTKVHLLDEVVLHAVVKNFGPQDTTVNLLSFEDPTLAIRVINATGDTMGSVPPSVPPLNLAQYERVLHPGDTLWRHFRLNDYQVTIPPGSYRAFLDGLPGDTVTITVLDTAAVH